MAHTSATPDRESRIYADGRFEVREVDNPDSWLSTTAPALVKR
ncbi:MAG: hypothetical protein V5A31_00670 [Haloferacaceae archaeon]|jgi:hypothetical protein